MPPTFGLPQDMELAALIEVPVDQSLTTGKHDKYRIQLTFRWAGLHGSVA
jgi:hypothetical protein